MKVAIYLRVSTLEQKEGGGFERQEEVCRKFCASRGWEVMGVLRESQSGSDAFDARPQLLAALNSSWEGVKAIVVERADRIARDLIVSELFFREARERKLEVYSADYGEEMVNAAGNETRVLIRQILAALSQWEKAQIVKKLQAGRKLKKEKTGDPCGGPTPYGVGNVGEYQGAKLILSFMDDEMSLRDVVAVLNSRPNIPPPRGGKWTRGAVHRIYHYWKTRRSTNPTFSTP